jgi:phosphoribosylglycinamide formyltransferase 1
VNGPLRVAVLASGRGSNLQALIDAERDARLPIELVFVASDKAKAVALRRADEAGIDALALSPSRYIERAKFDEALFAAVATRVPDLIVLAGFMRILSAHVLSPWAGRIVNIHPSLLPKYRGLDTHRRALEAGDRVHGASVHFVTPELDGGPTLAQAEIEIEPGDTPDGLAERLLVQEHRLIVASVGLIAARRAALVRDRVVVDGTPLAAPLLLGPDGVLARR